MLLEYLSYKGRESEGGVGRNIAPDSGWADYGKGFEAQRSMSQSEGSSVILGQAAMSVNSEVSEES